MPCERSARFRHNTIAFWLSDDEKMIVEARIKISGLKKGEYYRSAILGQKVEIIAGKYRSERLAIVLERMMEEMEGGDDIAKEEIITIIKELLLLLS